MKRKRANVLPRRGHVDPAHAQRVNDLIDLAINIRQLLRDAHQADLTIGEFRDSLNGIPGLSNSRKDLLCQVYVRETVLLTARRSLEDYMSYWSESDPLFTELKLRVRTIR